MKVTFNTPIAIPDIGECIPDNILLDPANQQAVLPFNVSSLTDESYAQFDVTVGNLTSIGFRANPDKTPAYSNFVIQMTLNTPGLYDQVATAFIKNGGTVDTAMKAILPILISAGLIPAGTVS